MNKIYLFLLIILLEFLIQKTSGQEYFNPIGSRSRGMADVSVSFDDPWASFNNQAGLALLRKPSVGVFAENKFNLKELNGGAFTFNFPLKSQGTLAVDYYLFNYSVLFSRQKFGLAYASRLSQKVYAGIQLNYLRTITENYQVRNTVFGEAGLFFIPKEKTKLGLHIFNPTVARYDKFSNEKVPVIFSFGGAYHVAEKALLAAEIEHSSFFGYGLKAGLEYTLNQTFKIRAGFRNAPVISTFGLSCLFAGLNIDIAFQIHQILGYSPSFSAFYIFDENKKQ